MSNNDRRKFIAGGLALSSGSWLGSANANSSLPAVVIYLLDGATFFSGVTTSSMIPFCLTQSGDDYIVQALVFQRRFFEGKSTKASPNTITMLRPTENQQLKMIVTSIGNGMATGTFRLSQLPGDDEIDSGTFSAPQAAASCVFAAPTATFSNCVITQAVDDGAKTEIGFTFKMTTTPPLQAENLSTIDFELVFQPSGTVVPSSWITSINANGDGVSSFIPPFNITGEDSVALTLNGVDGLEPPQVTSCSAPSVVITDAID